MLPWEKYASTDNQDQKPWEKYGSVPTGKSLMTQAMEYPSQTARPDLRTLPEQVGSLINPMPFVPTLSNPVPNIPAEFEKKRALADQAGRTARDVLYKGVGDVVSNTSALASKYLPKSIADILTPAIATSGGIVGTALHVIPMTPTENAAMQAPGMMLDAISRGTQGVSESMVNRGTPTPKAIRESRLEKGQPSVGSDRLTLPKDQVGDLATNNPTTTFNAAKVAINNLSNQIKARINELTSKGAIEKPGQTVSEYVPLDIRKSSIPGPGSNTLNPDLTVSEPLTINKGFSETSLPKGYTPSLQKSYEVYKSVPKQDFVSGGEFVDKYVPSEAVPIKPNLAVGKKAPLNGINTKEVADSIDPIMARVAENRGTNDAAYKALVRLKNGWLQSKPEVGDFLQGNNWRINLGDEVGKGFNKETSAIPEVVEAQMRMWQTLRNKIGEIDPKLDDLLDLQHKVIDIKNSVKPEAALGYSKHGITDYVKSPIETMQRNVGLADTLQNTLTSAPMKSLGKVSGIGINSVPQSLADRVKELKR